MFTHWNSSLRKSCPFLNSIYLSTMSVWTHGHLLYFILWVKIQYYHYSFYYSGCSNLGHQAPSSSYCVLSTSSQTFLSIYLISSTTRCSRLTLYFPWLRPGIKYVSKKKKNPSSFYQRIVFKNKSWVLIATGVSPSGQQFGQPPLVFVSLLNSLAGNH